MIRTRLAGVAVAAALVVGPTADGAFTLQDLDLRIQTAGGATWNIQNGDNLTNSITSFEQVGEFRFRIQGAFSTANWSADWDLLIDEDPFVNANFAFTNNTGADNDFVVIIGASVQPIAPSSVMQGSISGSVGSGQPGSKTATFGASAGDSVYTALIDGGAVQTLLDDAFSVSTAFTTTFGTADFGIPSPIPGPSVASSLAIRHAFFLTAGDSATISSAFVVNIPTPGAAVLFGIAGLITLRRRTR